MGQSITAAQMEEYREIVRGKLEDDELRRLHRIYYSAASDGLMGPNEFGSYIRGLQIFKGADRVDNFDILFRGYDQDCDGCVSFREFLLYHLAMLHSTEELFEVVYSMYDVDRDGLLCREEMIYVMTTATRWVGDCDIESLAVQEAIRQEVDRIIAVSDLNQDGKIGKDELRAVCRRHPAVLEKLKNLV